MKTLLTPKTDYRMREDSSDDDANEIVNLLINQTSEYCRQIKRTLHKQLNLNIQANSHINEINNPTVSSLKNLVLLLNKDLHKIGSLLNIFVLAQKPMQDRDDPNEDRILKMCMFVKQLACTINKDPRRTETYPPILNGMINSIFTYQTANVEMAEVMKQIEQKLPHVNPSQPNLSQIFDKYQRESTKYFEYNENSLAREMEAVKYENSEIKSRLNETIAYLNKNELEFISNIKKYNSYIEELKELNYRRIRELELEKVELRELNLKLKKQNLALSKEISQDVNRTTHRTYINVTKKLSKPMF